MERNSVARKRKPWRREKDRFLLACCAMPAQEGHCIGNQAAVTSVSRDLNLHLRGESHRVQNWRCRTVAFEFRQNFGRVKRCLSLFFRRNFDQFPRFAVFYSTQTTRRSLPASICGPVATSAALCSRGLCATGMHLARSRILVAPGPNHDRLKPVLLSGQQAPCRTGLSLSSLPECDRRVEQDWEAPGKPVFRRRRRLTTVPGPSCPMRERFQRLRS